MWTLSIDDSPINTIFLAVIHTIEQVPRTDILLIKFQPALRQDSVKARSMLQHRSSEYLSYLKPFQAHRIKGNETWIAKADATTKFLNGRHTTKCVFEQSTNQTISVDALTERSLVALYLNIHCIINSEERSEGEMVLQQLALLHRPENLDIIWD